MNISAAGAAEEISSEELTQPEPETIEAPPAAPAIADDGFEKARPQLEQELMQKKQNDVLMAHLEDLSKEADIEIDLEAYDSGNPETMIARVNGTEISKNTVVQFEQQQLRAAGVQEGTANAQQLLANFRPLIVEQLVNTLLIQQKAEAEGIIASDELVDQEYKRYASQFGGVEALNQQLAQISVSEDDLRNEIREQLPVQLYISEYLKENFDPEHVKITEKELREFYAKVKEQM